MSLRMQAPHRDFMPSGALHQQANFRSLSHDELVQLQGVAAEAGFAADPG
ncbi:MAG: hypothetical protein ACU0DH_12780 [Paracoccus sp. (in: a-proteobacteria)]